VLKLRAGPNSTCSPAVALNTPPLPLTSRRFSARLQSATSSPKTRMQELRRISSRSVAFTESTMVIGSPRKCGCVSNSSDVGSIFSE
jgi:hypothetical protein